MSELRVPQMDFTTLGELPTIYRKAQLQSARDAALQGATTDNSPQSLASLGTQLLRAGDMEGAMTLANLSRSISNDQWNRQYQTQSLELQRQNANKPQVIGSTEAGYFAVPPTVGAPGGGQPTQLIPGTPKSDSIPMQVQERHKAVVAQGLDPKAPANQAFILSGRMPREDQQPLTATDKKFIGDADEAVLAANQAIESLKKAKDLSPKAMGFKGAGAIAQVGSVFGNDTSEATVELDNTVTSNALTQLKAIFGGAPTEGERKILLDIQGSSSLPDAVRQKIYDRAILMAQNRLRFNEARAAELRGGTFYKPGGGVQSTGGSAPKIGNAIDQARAAIAAGAPRDAVIQRLRQNGIDSRGL